MWQSRALGGGDVKLFAALGALLLPKLGFEAEACVFLSATLVAPLQLLYRGQLPQLRRRLGTRLKNAFRPKARRIPLDPRLATWFRLGPCFALGLVAEVILHWRAPW
jgi:prepilin peptidase CpaA